MLSQLSIHLQNHQEWRDAGQLSLTEEGKSCEHHDTDGGAAFQRSEGIEGIE